jgi:hypothetical protein
MWCDVGYNNIFGALGWVPISDVLAWLGLEANGFGLALGGFGFQNLQAKPRVLALAWLWPGLAQAMA